MAALESRPRLAGEIRETNVLIAHPDLFTDEFKNDNRKELERGTDGKLFRWRVAFETGNAFVEFPCSDARSETDDERVTEVSSVATGFPFKEDYADLYNDPRFKGIVYKTHWDSIKSKPGQRPIGCGGQDTAEAIASGRIKPGRGITGFVNNNVDQDPLVQGFLQASRTFANLRRNGSILVVTYDHRRAETHPVGEYSLVGGEERRNIPRSISRIVDARSRRERIRLYNPEEIYADGMPHIGVSSLSDESLEYLDISKHHMIERLDEYKDFEQRQEVQNPFALVIRDSKIPLSVVYPGIFGEPGSAFKVHIPRSKDGEVVLVGGRAIKAAVSQMEYAVTHSVANHGNPNAPFSGSRLVLIETSDMRQSEAIAQSLFREPWMQAWHHMDGHKVFLSESRAGITHRIDEIPKAA